MDFIEKVFHVSPDHGNGTAEFVIYGALVVLIVFSVAKARVKWVRQRRARGSANV
jgi:hypothetical protein